MQKHTGFTLIEMMTVVAMMTILASIALPSYRQYVIRNAEAQAQAQMKQLDVELNQWRSTALTYKGFRPKKTNSTGVVSYTFDNADNKTIYVPANSDATNYRYKITLVDGTDSSKSLVTTGTGVELVTGRSWVMLAEPNTTYRNGHKFLLNSQGLQCKTRNNDSSITVASANCGAYSEKW